VVFRPADAEAAIWQRYAPRRSALRPPLVERTATDPEIDAHLRDGELVALSTAADLVTAGHDGAFQPRCRTGRLAQAAEPTGTATCPS